MELLKLRRFFCGSVYMNPCFVEAWIGYTENSARSDPMNINKINYRNKSSKNKDL